MIRKISMIGRNNNLIENWCRYELPYIITSYRIQNQCYRLVICAKIQYKLHQALKFIKVFIIWSKKSWTGPMFSGRWWNGRRLSNFSANKFPNSRGAGEGVQGPVFHKCWNAENAVKYAEIWNSPQFVLCSLCEVCSV